MKISINLLPPEIIAEKLKKEKFYKIQFIGVVIILIMVFLTSLALTLRLLQSRNIMKVNAKLAQAQQKVESLKGVEQSVMVLKNRLTVVNQYLGISSKQSSMYKFIDNLMPASLVVTSISVGKGGEVVLQVYMPDPAGLDEFLDSLLSGEDEEHKISDVAIDSLNRGRDGLYRVSFKINPK